MGIRQDVLELMLLGPAIFTAHRRRGSATGVENERVAPGPEVAGARPHVHGKDTSSKNRADDRAGNDVLRSFEKRVNHTVNGGTTWHAAWHLCDHQARILNLGMAPVEFHQHFCHLLGRGHPNVSDDAAVQAFRVVEVDDVLWRSRRSCLRSSGNVTHWPTSSVSG
jgi:hypothetical protein